MARQSVDKLAKVNDNFTVNMYDNGFMVDIGGRDAMTSGKMQRLFATH